MENYTNRFNEHSESLRSRRERDDRDDYNFAQTDVDVGRIRKHLPSEEVDPITGKKKDKVLESMQRTLDWLLLNDPIYKQAYDSAWSALNNAENATEAVLANALQTLEDAQANLDDVLSRAAHRPNGTRVFKDANGYVWTEHGDKLDDATAATIEWRGDEPSYEDYTEGQARVDNVRAAIDELRGIQVELGGYRNEMTDQNNPLYKNRLDGIRDRAREIEAGTAKLMEEEKAASYSADDSSMKLETSSQTLLPSLGTNQ